jgi:hypothetical protein
LTLDHLIFEILLLCIHEGEDMKEVLRDVVVLLQEDDRPKEMLRDLQTIEHTVGLPPPVVLCLQNGVYSIKASIEVMIGPVQASFEVMEGRTCVNVASL